MTGACLAVIAAGGQFNRVDDLGFALQARCLEAVANGSVDASSCVVPVPARIDAAIATSYLDRKYPAAPGARRI
jgi:S-adenosylhomocysteine hydrolase